MRTTSTSIAALISVVLIVLSQACGKRSQDTATFNQAGRSQFHRNAHSMVYHPKDSVIYLFGGASEKEVMSDLWVFNGSNWSQLHIPEGPSPRTFAAFSYDPTNNRLLLFGGSRVLFGQSPGNANLLNDTWQLQANRWRQLQPQHAPQPRAEMSMVYDPVRKSMMLFGGYFIEAGNYIKLADTWEFKDGAWSQISDTGPTARHGVAMTHHTELNAIVLFGGSTVDKQYGPGAGETWIWNHPKWNKLDITQPPGVFNAAIAFDPYNGELVRFGGWNGDRRTDQTWVLGKKEWQMLNTETSPAPRNHSAMAYDEKNRRTILFGGHDGQNVFGDTWEFKNGKWRKLIDQPSKKRIQNAH